jgi:hypothetical protein
MLLVVPNVKTGVCSELIAARDHFEWMRGVEETGDESTSVSAVPSHTTTILDVPDLQIQI